MTGGRLAEAANTSATQTPSWMRARDLICVLGFAVFWLAPILYEGIARQPLHAWMPEACHDQFRITCLFTVKQEYALEFYVQATTGGGSWFTLLDEEYTPMRPFGYYNRNWALMHGFNNRALRQYWLNQQPRSPETIESLDQAQREIDANKQPAQELTSWYRARYEAKHPDQAKLAGIRVLAVWHPVGSEIATPDGHWQRSRIEDVPTERILVIIQRNFGRS